MPSLAEAIDRAWELMQTEGHTVGSVMHYFQRFTPEERREISTELLDRDYRKTYGAPGTPVKTFSSQTFHLPQHRRV